MTADSPAKEAARLALSRAYDEGRAAGRAEVEEELAATKRDLDTAQHNTTRHNQDLAAVPFQVAWQRDQMQERIEALQVELREAREALQWCLDEGGWRLMYYGTLPVPDAIEYDGGTSTGKVRILSTATEEG